MTDHASLDKCRIIALIGSDGAGKTTQAKRLARWLRDREQSVVLSLSYTVQPLKRVLQALATRRGYRKKGEEVMGSEATHFAYAAVKWTSIDRALQSSRDVKFVIFDRYAHCHIAASRALGLKSADVIEQMFAVFPEPYLTVRLRIRPTIAMERIVRRGTDIEAPDPEYLIRSEKEYDRLTEAVQSVVCVSGEEDEDSVAAAISAIVRQRCPEIGGDIVESCA